MRAAIRVIRFFILFLQVFFLQVRCGRLKIYIQNVQMQCAAGMFGGMRTAHSRGEILQQDWTSFSGAVFA
jgi:hypothetical protein